jgi:hypothetical protein
MFKPNRFATQRHSSGGHQGNIMAELKLLEEHLIFQVAAKRARDLAVQHRIQTGLKRTPSGWAVLIPPNEVSIRSYVPFDDEDYQAVDDDPPDKSMRHGLESCADSYGRIYLGDGIYI